ncbi:MAG TPA: PP2C family protein-serine/threonine phosphatase [Jatrophihabitans sp.]|uniref:PP2C family protein-serine/threonine phosphatase n=1 Tax=Jatrophihabitans sp. TaxID=1932789 RepID=UPI002DF85F8B|nr:PP2C family protein-serine/threonine phosphatase [Jatrophihabitans sp.]
MTVDARDRPVTRLLLAHQTAQPDAFVETLAAAVAGIGGRDVVLLLIDYAHVALTPHPDVLMHGSEPEVASLDGSMAGRAFTSSTTLAAERDDGWHVWVPVSEQSNRLGVLAMTLSRWDDEIEFLVTELGLAAAPLLLASAQYTDLPHLLRRRHDMDLAAEMQWSLLPPLSFAAAGATIAGLLEPAYEVGGDCFDYAFNAGRLDFAVLDTVGHGLSSAVLAALLVGAYRHGRRAGDDFAQLASRIDAAARTFPGRPAFATAVLGRLDTAHGLLTWMTCGHPLPIIVRDGSILSEPCVRPGLPLGIGALGSVVGDIVETRLQPGDGVLLYTDGVTDSAMPDGTPFGEQRLRDLFAREHTAGASPHEVVRRLIRTAIEHSATSLRDDATMVYLRWDG